MAAPRKWHGTATLNNDTPVAIKAAVTGRTHYVTKITLSITTHAAKFVAIQDGAGSPVVIAKHTDASAAAGVPSVVTWDFGRSGVPITVSTALNAVSEASGVAGKVYAEGYSI